jgi:hypothetical protein
MASKSNQIDDITHGTVTKLTPFQVMLRAMSFDATEGDASFDDSVLNAMLEAETEEDVWEADERPPLNFQHLDGCEIEILDINVKYSRDGNNGIKKSAFTWDGKQMYILVKCIRLSEPTEKSLINLPPIGAEFTANTSARYTVVKLWKFLTMGLIDPNTGRSLQCLVKSTDLGGGEAVIKIRPIPRRAVQLPAE